MKTIAAVLLLTLACPVRGDEPSTNLIAIHLLEKPVGTHRSPHDSIGVLKLRAVSPPVLSDSDFVAFDITHQTFAIQGATAIRLSSALWSWTEGEPTIAPSGMFPLIPPGNVPFVLMVRGEPVYSGEFTSNLSSTSFPGPFIQSRELMMSTRHTPDPTYVFSIQLGDPGPTPGTPDPRNDPRIALAAEMLFVLRK